MFLMRVITKIIVHCADTFTDMDIGAREINRWHTDKGWDEIGYHYVIRRDGTLEEGRDVNKAGAHAKGHNGNSIGVCLVGGKSRKTMGSDFNFTFKQMIALREFLLRKAVEHPNAEILGHRDLPDVYKACPTFNVVAFMGDI